METEAKFRVPGEAAFARLKGAERFGDYERRDESTKQVHDRYLDTARHSFLNNGWCLRLRKGKEGDLLVTIKGLERRAIEGASSEGIAAREEHEVAVPGLAISRWPAGEAKRLARSLAGSQSLRDIVQVDQSRTVSILYSGDRAVAELSLDEVVFKRGVDDNSPHLAYELEAEMLPDGTLADIQALSRIFAEQYGLDPQPLSKFEQALALTNSDVQAEVGEAVRTTRVEEAEKSVPHQIESPPDAGPSQAGGEQYSRPTISLTDSMGDAGRKVIAHQYRALQENEDGTRLGETPEAVHHMRVATRRMRAAMLVFGTHFSGKRAERVRDGLQQVARALGEVRDLDVQIDKAEAFRVALPPDAQGGLTSMIEEWRVRRWKARKALVRLLDSREYREFKRNMERFLEEESKPPDQTEGAQAYQVRHVLGSVLMQHYEAMRAFEALERPTITQLHALRISGKYLRYTLEFFRDVLPKDARGMIKDIVKLQDSLGQLNDAEIATALAHSTEVVAHRADDKRHTGIPGVEAYLADLQATIESMQSEYKASWEKLQSVEWNKRLADLMVGAVT